MLKPIATLCSVIALAGALVGCDKIDAQTVKVNIEFNEAGCPTGISDEVITAVRRQFITWQAVDANGAEASVPFRIFFDPIQGQPLKARGGRLRRPIDARAPLVEYKYTIVGDLCPDAPRDPRIRVAS